MHLIECNPGNSTKRRGFHSLLLETFSQQFADNCLFWLTFQSLSVRDKNAESAAPLVRHYRIFYKEVCVIYLWSSIHVNPCILGKISDHIAFLGGSKPVRELWFFSESARVWIEWTNYLHNWNSLGMYLLHKGRQSQCSAAKPLN